MIDKIKVNNITKVFDSVIALNNVNIQFEKGKVYALLGHNGAGKTTLIQNILGIQKLKKTIDSGEIIYLSNEIKIRGNEYKNHLSYSPEIYSLFEDLSVMEYLTFVAKVYKRPKSSEELIKKLIEYFELKGKENRFIYSLSNGMKRKVAHIAALLTESDFCFLDEPFSGLDPVSIFKLKSFLCDDIEKNRTYIISTHQLAILESIVIPDELMVILLMKDGKLIHQGTKENLLESTGEESIEKAYIKLS